jgi:hypothetical protein
MRAAPGIYTVDTEEGCGIGFFSRLRASVSGDTLPGSALSALLRLILSFLGGSGRDART